MTVEHICLTCSGFYPAKDFTLVQGKGYWLHKVDNEVHSNNNRATPRNQQVRKQRNMATKKTAPKSAATNGGDQFLNFLLELNALTAKYLGDAGVQSAAKKVVESDEDEDEDDSEITVDPKRILSEKALKTVPLDELREMVVAWGYDEEEVEGAKKPELIEALLSEYAEAEDGDSEDEDEEDADEDDQDDDAEDDAEDDEDDEDDEDEGDEEDDEDDTEAEREELMSLTLAKLRKTARDDYNATAAELKGLDKEAIVDLILGAEDEDDSDVEVDEDQDDEDGYTEDELAAMDADELKEILDEWEVDYTPKARKTTLVKLVLEAQDEDEYDDE